MRLRPLLLILTLLACASLRERALPRAWAATGTYYQINTGLSQAQPPSATQVMYNSWPSCSNQLWATAESNYGTYCPQAITFTDWHVTIETAPGVGKSWTFTVRKNSASTSMAVTIADAAKTATYTGTLTVASGDLLTIQSSPSGTPTAAGGYTWYTKTTGIDNWFNWSYSTSAIPAAQRWVAVSGGSSTDQVTENRPIAVAGTFKNLYIHTNQDVGAAQSIALTLQTGADPGNLAPTMADTTLTATISSGANDANDTTHTAHVDPGAFAQWHVVPTGSIAAGTKFYLSVEFTPDTPGDTLYYGEDSGQAQSATVYNHQFTVKATETNVLTPLPALTIKRLWAYVHAGTSTYGAMTAGGTFTLTLRKNQVDTTLTAQAAGSGDVRKATDVTHTVAFSTGDLASFRFDVTTTGTCSAHYSADYAVAQPAGGAAGSLSLLGIGN